MAMLCCVSRKAAAGGNGPESDNAIARCRASAELSRFVEVCKDLNRVRGEEGEALRRLDEAVLDVAAVASSFTTFKRLESLPEEAIDPYRDAQPEVLLPCGVCSRKFNPRSLDKHVKICERTAVRKRKPFDSAKQRIQGTELAEFLPKHEQQQTHHHTQHHHNHHHHHHNNESRRVNSGGNHAEDRAICHKPNNAWKQTRDEFLKAIRAARGDTQQHPASQSQSHVPSHQQQQQQHQHQQQTSQTATSQQRPSTLSLVNTTGAPTRPNEKGQCPTCQRQFGVKSYERHVAFCRERATRLPASPQTSNVAKERLEARMRYRAPALKNRRPTNREKYSPGAHKAVVNQSPLLARTTAKETIHAAPATTPTSAQKNAETASPKLPMLKRPVQSSKESPVTNSGPLKSRPMDRSNSGVGKDYNPFLLAEQQLNDLFSDTSDQSSTDGSSICPPQKPNSSPNFPLSHSSAFVKYPNNTNSQQQQQQQQSQQTTSDKQQRISLIAPPTGFDDLTSSDLSSDCTETNSLSREFLTSSSNSNSLAGSRVQMINNAEQRDHVLGRRVIIDQSQALGGGEFAPERSSTNQQTKLTNGSNTNTNGLNSRVARPVNNTNCNRSNSMRSSSAPKPPERKISSSSSSGSSDFSRNNKLSNAKTNKNSSSNDVENQQQRGDNNYKNLNGSNLSLSSIISSTDMEMKRSNSLFDELLSSFEEDVNSSSTLPSLMSLMRNDPTVSFLSSSTPQQNGVNGHHQRGTNNGRINCSDDDGDLSSPESVKRQECGGKLSADSAYSSLNRKYSNHERSTNDVSSGKFKLSKFCHECGFKFPDSAKFCCECGVKRLTL